MTEIYVATQKEIRFTLPDGYKPIFVGASLREKQNPWGYMADNTGDNISTRNKTFCELTALYWMWKNSKADTVGLMHYRRYLSKHALTSNPQKISMVDDLEEMLERYDLILPKKSCLWGSVRHQYEIGQHVEDYDCCGEIIRNRFPDYYESFLSVSESDSIYICNMFVGKKEIISKYCEWLFTILFELETKVDISNYSVSEKRIFGYLSERLFNVWILHNAVKVKELNLLNTEMSIGGRLKSYIHALNYKVFRIDVLRHSAKRVEKRRGSKNA